MKPAILVLTFLGVAPSVLLSAFLLLTVPWSRQNSELAPDAKRITLSQRMHSVIFLQGKKLTLDTILWWPALVLLFGVLFLAVVILMFRTHS